MALTNVIAITAWPMPGPAQTRVADAEKADAAAQTAQRPVSRRKRYTYGVRSNASTTYRTVCVRLCDGFYFPISESSQPGNFLADEKSCQAQCGAPVSLFYRQGYDDDAANMVALTGERYGDLLNAFRYRKEYVAACDCKPKPWSAGAQAVYDTRALIAGRSPLERVIAAGTREAGALLAGTQDAVAAVKPTVPLHATASVSPNAKASRSEPRYTRAAEKPKTSPTPQPQLQPRSRPWRYSADVPPAIPRQQYVPQRRGLFQPRNR